MRDEYSKLFKVEHENIIKLLKFGEEGQINKENKIIKDITYLKMEFISGSTLEDLIDFIGGQLDEDEAKLFFL